MLIGVVGCEDGKDGERGVMGITGPSGTNGGPGANGNDGAAGQDGANGQNGATGLAVVTYHSALDVAAIIRDDRYRVCDNVPVLQRNACIRTARQVYDAAAVAAREALIASLTP